MKLTFMVTLFFDGLFPLLTKRTKLFYSTFEAEKQRYRHQTTPVPPLDRVAKKDK